MDVLVVVELGVELAAELGADVAAGHPVPRGHRHRQRNQHQRQNRVTLTRGKRLLSIHTFHIFHGQVMLTGLYLNNGLVDSQQLLRLGVVARVVEVKELPPVIKQFVSITNNVLL